MNRFWTLVLFVLVCLPVLAEDPPKKLTPEQHTELETKWKELTKTGIKVYQVGKFSDALKSWEDALKLAHQLYNVAEFPDGHKNLANSLNNLAALYFAEGKYAAAESYYKEALATYKRLSKGEDFENVAAALNNLAALYRSQGKYSEAEPLTKEALAMYKRLSKGEDSRDLAGGLNYLALLYWSQGRLAEAEPLYKDALAMYKRLSKGEDNPELANSLNNLALLYRSQGKLAEAEPLYKDTLTMYKRLSKGEDHREVANSLNNLASLYETQDKYTDAEPLYKDALDLYKRLLKNKDHPELARSLSKLASLYCSQGKYAEAEPLYMEAVAMYKRLFKGEDHPDLARSLNGLVDLFYSQGKYVDAETLCKEVLAMRKRLFKDEDNAEVASSLNHLGNLNDALGKYSDAEPLYKDALASYRRLITRFALDKTEGEALTLLANQPMTRDSFLSCTKSSQADAMRVYSQIWLEKGYVARVYEQRQLRTRGASADSRASQMLSDFIAARRRRAELLLAPKPRDPATRDKRDEEITTLDQLIEEKTRELKKLLPALERADKLTGAKPDDLQKALPSNVAVVDFLRFVHFQYDKDKPGKQGQTRTQRYLVFVLTREKVAWVDLGTAETIESAVNAWREAITGNKEIPEAIPAKVRELVWAKVRKELPSAITTVYVCPDAALCKVPFAALPGDKLGTILLEDYAWRRSPTHRFCSTNSGLKTRSIARLRRCWSSVASSTMRN
jgi:tetratricopeptide (TPR) repeat protein